MISFTSISQSRHLQVGVEGGIGFSSLRGNHLIETQHEARMGSCIGLFVHAQYAKRISLRSGCYYEQKGSSFQFPVTDANGVSLGTLEGKQKFTYFTIPILLRASLGNAIRYFVNAGPSIGFLIKQTQMTEPFAGYPQLKSNHTSDYKLTEFGVAVGAGIVLPVNENVFLSFEARDGLGLSNTSAIPAGSNGSVKTQSINFLLGVGFHPGRTKTEVD